MIPLSDSVRTYSLIGGVKLKAMQYKSDIAAKVSSMYINLQLSK